MLSNLNWVLNNHNNLKNTNNRCFGKFFTIMYEQPINKVGTYIKLCTYCRIITKKKIKVFVKTITVLLS